MIATFVYMKLWGTYHINMLNATPLSFAKIGIFWMSNEGGKGQAYLPHLLHIEFLDLTRFRHLSYGDIKQ